MQDLIYLVAITSVPVKSSMSCSLLLWQQPMFCNCAYRYIRQSGYTPSQHNYPMTHHSVKLIL